MRKLLVYGALVLAISGCGGDSSTGSSGTNEPPKNDFSEQPEPVYCHLGSAPFAALQGQPLTLDVTLTKLSATSNTIDAVFLSPDGVSAPATSATPGLLAVSVTFPTTGTKTITVRAVAEGIGTALCSTTVVVTKPLDCTLSVEAKKAQVLPFAPFAYYHYLVTATVPDSARATHPRILAISTNGVKYAQDPKSNLQWDMVFVNDQPLHPKQKDISLQAVVVDDEGRTALCSAPASVWAY